MVKKKTKAVNNGTMEFEGKTWRIEADHTTANIVTTFVRNGVARTEVIVKEGHPTEFEELLNNKDYKVLYSWNVKTLAREEMNKNNLVKFRETALLQAEGINGEGKQFQPGEDDTSQVGSYGEGIVNNDSARMKQKWNEMSAKTKMMVIAAYTGIVIAVAAAITWVVGLFNK